MGAFLAKFLSKMCMGLNYISCQGRTPVKTKPSMNIHCSREIVGIVPSAWETLIRILKKVIHFTFSSLGGTIIEGTRNKKLIRSVISGMARCVH